MKQEICAVCLEHQAKYTCPRCKLRSCSLDCVRRHKIAQSCSGERSVTHYIKLAKFSDNDLYSDYNFLHKGREFAHQISKTNNNKGSNNSNNTKEKRWGNGMQQEKLGKKAMLLKKAAKNCGINLLLLPTGMYKHQQNRSYFHISNKNILWTVRLIISFETSHTGGSNTSKEKSIEFIEHNFPQDMTMQELWLHYLSTTFPSTSIPMSISTCTSAPEPQQDQKEQQRHSQLRKLDQEQIIKNIQSEEPSVARKPTPPKQEFRTCVPRESLLELSNMLKQLFNANGSTKDIITGSQNENQSNFPSPIPNTEPDTAATTSTITADDSSYSFSGVGSKSGLDLLSPSFKLVDPFSNAGSVNTSEFDGSVPLASVLKGSKVVEFPTIIITLFF